MGSRLRHTINHFFECFCEVVGPKNENESAWVIQSFPDHFKDESVLKSVAKFAFPCEIDKSIVQQYSFVFTNAESKWTFGFCRHDPSAETALVVLTYLPWHDSFFKFLTYIANLTKGSEAGQLIAFLNAVYQSEIPRPNFDLAVAVASSSIKPFTCEAPNPFQLPSIPQNRNLTEYYNAVDNRAMLIIFASMLYERRIIFTSNRLMRLSACVEAAQALLYPMTWQHIFIPVLPKPLIDYLLAPMPFLIGLHKSLWPHVKKSDLGEVVVIDLDGGPTTTPFSDLESLPSEIVNSMYKSLHDRISLLEDGVSRVFLRALVRLIGGYRDALKITKGRLITFDKEAFLRTRPLSMQPFLAQMLELQLFQQFIEDRLQLLNSGLGFSDEFEKEACNQLDKSNGKLQQYSDWLRTAKRQSTALIRNMQNRANPAVTRVHHASKTAVRTVRDRGGRGVRTAYDGLRSKFSRPRNPQRHKPNSAPSSPTSVRKVVGAAIGKELDPRRKFSTPMSFLPNQQPSYSPLTGSSSYEDLKFDTNLMSDFEVIFRDRLSVKSTADRTDATDQTKPGVRKVEENHQQTTHTRRKIETNRGQTSQDEYLGISDVNLIELDSNESSWEEFDPLKFTAEERESLPVISSLSRSHCNFSSNSNFELGLPNFNRNFPAPSDNTNFIGTRHDATNATAPSTSGKKKQEWTVFDSE